MGGRRGSAHLDFGDLGLGVWETVPKSQGMMPWDTGVKGRTGSKELVNWQSHHVRELAENEIAELQRIDGCGSDNSKTE